MSKPVQPQLVFGLGTGRCGTQSLAYLLNAQRGARVFHEIFEDKLTWQQAEAWIDRLLAWAQQQPQQRLVGDVAFSYLPYVRYIWAQNPTAKFVCLQRERCATVQSYLQWTKQHNPWMTHDGQQWPFGKWDACYPKYVTSSKAEAIGLYWDDYYATAHTLQTEAANAFQLFAMEELNTHAGQRAILRFVGLPEEEIRSRLPLQFHQNSLNTPTRSMRQLIADLRQLPVALDRLWVRRQLLKQD